MSMKLLLAKPADGAEGAKLFFEFSGGGSFKHQLKFHQDSAGYWYPELRVNFGGLKDTDLDELVGEIAAVLGLAAQTIRTQGHIAKGLATLLS